MEGRKEEQCVADLDTSDPAIGDLGKGELGVVVPYKAELDGSNAVEVGYWLGVDEIINKA